MNLYYICDTYNIYIRIWLGYIRICTICGGGTNRRNFNSVRILLKTRILAIIMFVPCKNPPGYKEQVISSTAFLFG